MTETRAAYNVGPMPRPEYLRLVRSWPRLSVTTKYAQLMALRGGSQRAHPRSCGVLYRDMVILVAGEVRGKDG